MLKLQPRSWQAVPRLVALEASIHASETLLEREIVERWELLLYSLALEFMTGRPAGFVLPPGSKPSSPRVVGVSVRLDAQNDPDATYSFLEKLVHVLLPSQMGFEGVTPPMPANHDPWPGRKAEPDHRVAPLRPFATELKLTNLLAFPDLERHFSRFEALRGMRVRLEMEGVAAEDCAALLSGLSVPLLTGPAADAALAEAAEQAERRRRGQA
ncbi:hypothetical protein GPECTOR_70g521 [Gonium pectorale]|uniref:Uncharacterized protein n=1 Tax=Gonium pectorale TaxID=33097 RepID=A0A150G4Q5_GONPE|nr:hypothetical protein GPECTOR_70g521 [Gonium pectorale]|eukprot:KXZ44290.1 hypothetical protein GPECTOR_70g521 [Gonium pectorale]